MRVFRAFCILAIIFSGISVLLCGCVTGSGEHGPRTVAGGWYTSSPATTNEQEWKERYEELQAINDSLTRKINELQAQPQETVVVREIVSQIEEVPVYRELRDFQDMDELRAWVDAWAYTPTSVNGTVDLLSDANDCDDWTLAMVRDAAADGYITGVVLDVERSHLLVCCIIGNRFYFVEPQSGDIYETLHNTYWLVD